MKQNCSKCGKLEYMAEFPGEPPLCVDCFFGVGPDDTGARVPHGDIVATAAQPVSPGVKAKKATASSTQKAALDINPFKLF